jgi:hypothetical protein
MRSHHLNRVEATKTSEQDWRKFVNDIASEGLWYEAKSWYVGANIPGKLLENMNFTGGLGLYRQRCRESAEQGYKGYEFLR